MGGFMAWILGSKSKDQLRVSNEPPTNAEEQDAFAHEAVEKPEPYFSDDAAPEGHEPADSNS